jgi:hypothetical protein
MIGFRRKFVWILQFIYEQQVGYRSLIFRGSIFRSASSETFRLHRDRIVTRSNFDTLFSENSYSLEFRNVLLPKLPIIIFGGMYKISTYTMVHFTIFLTLYGPKKNLFSAGIKFYKFNTNFSISS